MSEATHEVAMAALFPQSSNGAIPKPLTLRQKLLRVMSDIGFVKKAGRNPEFKYDYARASDVFDAAREAMAKHGVLWMPIGEDVEYQTTETAKGTALTICRVTLHIDLMDADSEERMPIIATGEGRDTQDKSYYKAVTGAQKYALIKTFLIPTGDDPEATEGEETVGRPKPEQRQSPACPACGQIGTLRRSKPEYGGGFYCWKKEGVSGGCGAKWKDEAELKAAREKPKPEPEPKSETVSQEGAQPSPEDEALAQSFDESPEGQISLQEALGPKKAPDPQPESKDGSAGISERKTGTSERAKAGKVTDETLAAIYATYDEVKFEDLGARERFNAIITKQYQIGVGSDEVPDFASLSERQAKTCLSILQGRVKTQGAPA